MPVVKKKFCFYLNKIIKKGLNPEIKTAPYESILDRNGRLRWIYLLADGDSGIAKMASCKLCVIL